MINGHTCWNMMYIYDLYVDKDTYIYMEWIWNKIHDGWYDVDWHIWWNLDIVLIMENCIVYTHGFDIFICVLNVGMDICMLNVWSGFNDCNCIMESIDYAS